MKRHLDSLLNEDAMATEKFEEGIRSFVTDAIKLDQLIAQLASSSGLVRAVCSDAD